MRLRHYVEVYYTLISHNTDLLQAEIVLFTHSCCHKIANLVLTLTAIRTQ